MFVPNNPNRLTYKGAIRKRKMFKWGRICSYVLIGFDAWVSYQVIRELADSAEWGFALALGIAASQWIVSEALFGARFNSLFVKDRNGDGEVSLAENLKWWAKVTALVGLYGVDIITNLASIDARGFGSLIWAVPLVPNNSLSASICALFFAIVLTFLDELLMVMIDSSEDEIDKSMPELIRTEADKRADMLDAEMYSRAKMEQAYGRYKRY